jgi:F-box and WD-40 domain protein 1/11
LQFDPTTKEDVIISGSSDSSVIVWRFSTGQKINEIPSAHEESVLNLRFDHRYLVTCSKDRKIKIWNRNALTATDQDYPKVKRSTQTARLPSYIVPVDDMEPSLLEARMANGVVRALRPYMLLMTLEGHGAAVNAIQIDGNVIVSASGDRLIKMWNVTNGQLVRSLQGHHKGIACVQFDSRRIVSGSSDNTVRIYDAYSSAELAELKGHTNLVRTIQAGFGDLPGSEEEDSKKARKVEQKYIGDSVNGSIAEDRELTRRIRNAETGSSKITLGSRLPPGGGGSKWGRIVSGSYDESIIIWRKNAQGDWVIGQTLRQDSNMQDNGQGTRPRPAAPATPQNTYPPLVDTLVPPPAPAPQPTSVPAPQISVGSAVPAVMSASQIVQQATRASLSSLGAGLSNVMGMGWPPQQQSRNATASASASSSTSINIDPQASLRTVMQQSQAAVSNAVQDTLSQVQPQFQQHLQQTLVNQIAANQANAYTQAQAQAQAQAQGQSSTSAATASSITGTTATPSPAESQPLINLQPDPNTIAPPLGPIGPPAQSQSVSRVFKLQFDARRIVCCSQDSRIVGWDFANGDPHIIEACRFFVGP